MDLMQSDAWVTPFTSLWQGMWLPSCPGSAPRWP